MPRKQLSAEEFITMLREAEVKQSQGMAPRMDLQDAGDQGSDMLGLSSCAVRVPPRLVRKPVELALQLADDYRRRARVVVPQREVQVDSESAE